MRRIVHILLPVLLGLTTVGAAALPTNLSPAEQSALATLKARQRVVEQAQAQLARAPRNPARQAALDQAIRETFDFEKLARVSIGAYWQRMTSAQREEYLRLFTNLVQASTVRKLKAYRAAGTEYVSIEGDTNLTVITTVVTSTSGDQAAIQYKLYAVNGRWWIWDTTIGLDTEISEYDVSTAQNYKSTFNRIIRTDGIPGLLSKLRAKATGGEEL